MQADGADSSERDSVNSSTALNGGLPKSQKTRAWASRIGHILEDQWFLLALGILIAIASQHQVPANQQDKKETIVSYLCVSIIFFVTGCTLESRALLNNYSRWVLHLFVQVQCFLMTSAVIFGVVSACATNKNFMDPALLIGFILAGCVPTTIASNVVMTKQAHGNTALTVVQSTIGNFLGPFLTPLLLKMYTSTGAWYTHVLPPDNGGYDELYRRVFKQLGLSIFLPMAVGQVVQFLFPQATQKVFTKWKFSKLGSLALLVILWSAYDGAFESKAFTSVKSNNMIFVVFISVALFLLYLTICIATSIPWLSKQDVISVAYCVPAKTPAIGIPLSQVLFVGLSRVTQAKIQIPMVIYQGLQVVAGSLLTVVFRHWVDRQEEDPT